MPSSKSLCTSLTQLISACQIDRIPLYTYAVVRQIDVLEKRFEAFALEGGGEWR